MNNQHHTENSLIERWTWILALPKNADQSKLKNKVHNTLARSEYQSKTRRNVFKPLPYTLNHPKNKTIQGKPLIFRPPLKSLNELDNFSFHYLSLAQKHCFQDLVQDFSPYLVYYIRDLGEIPPLPSKDKQKQKMEKSQKKRKQAEEDHKQEEDEPQQEIVMEKEKEEMEIEEKNRFACKTMDDETLKNLQRIVDFLENNVQVEVFNYSQKGDFVNEINQTLEKMNRSIRINIKELKFVFSSDLKPQLHKDLDKIIDQLVKSE